MKCAWFCDEKAGEDKVQRKETPPGLKPLETYSREDEEGLHLESQNENKNLPGYEESVT